MKPNFYFLKISQLNRVILCPLMLTVDTRLALPKARTLKLQPSKHQLQFSYRPTTSKTNPSLHFVQSLFCPKLQSNCSGNPFFTRGISFPSDGPPLLSSPSSWRYFNYYFHMDERHSVNPSSVPSFSPLFACNTRAGLPEPRPLLWHFGSAPPSPLPAPVGTLGGSPHSIPIPLSWQPCVGLSMAGVLPSPGKDELVQQPR